MKPTPAVAEQIPGRQMNPILFWVLLVLLVGFAAFIRFYDLKSDPPVVFEYGSQDLTTDGAYLTLHARQAVLYGQWDLFGYKDWMPLKVSVVSAVSYLIFKLVGVSRAAADAAGSVLSFCGILLFLFALWDRRRSRFMLLVALFLCTNTMMAIYGRVPLSENGLFFLAGLTFLVYSRWFHTNAGKIAVGILVAICGLLGKSFGMLLGAGPLLFILISADKNRFRDTLLLLVPALATFGLFWILFYSDQGFAGMLWDHGAGVHGFPHGLASPQGFIESLISYGRTGLHSCSIVVSLLFAIAVMGFLLRRTAIGTLDKTMLFMLGWFVSWVVVMSPFNYLPLRYFYILVVPISVVSATFLERLAGSETGGIGKFVWWRVIALLFASWGFVYYLCLPFLAPTHKGEDGIRAVWITMPVALIVAAIATVVFKNRKLVVNRAVAQVILLAAIAGTVVIEGYQQVQWLSARANLLEYASQDVKSLVGPDAVFAGTYGPALAYDNEIKTLPLFETDDWADVSRTLRSYPVTHLAVSQTTWNSLVGQHPELRKAPVVTHFWMRDVIVVLARVSDVFGNQAAGNYQLSDFEKIGIGIAGKNPDTVGFYLNRFVAARPTSRAGLAQQYYLTQQGQPLDKQRGCVEALLGNYPKDFVVCELAAIYFKAIDGTSGDPNDLNRSQELVERAVKYFPINEESIRRNCSTLSPGNRLL